MGLKNYLISGILLGLFTIAFLSFIYQTTEDNNSQTLRNNQYLNRTFNSINRTLESSQTTTNEQFNATTTENPVVGFGSIILFTIRGAGTIFSGLVIAILEPIFILSTSVLGIPSIVIGVLSSIVLIILILLAWKLYRLGI